MTKHQELRERSEKMLDLEKLKALEAAATPGPWIGQREYDGSRTICQVRATETLLCVNRRDSGGPTWKKTEENCALIAKARNALPELIAEIEHLRAENARLTARLNGVQYDAAQLRSERDACAASHQKLNAVLDAAEHVLIDEAGVDGDTLADCARALLHREQAAKHQMDLDVAQRDAAVAEAAALREALELWTSNCIEEGDLRLLMASLSGRALDESDVEFTRRYGAGLEAARQALATPPHEHFAKLKAEAGRERVLEAANLIRQTTPMPVNVLDSYDRGKYDGRMYAIEQIESFAKEGGKR